MASSTPSSSATPLTTSLTSGGTSYEDKLTKAEVTDEGSAQPTPKGHMAMPAAPRRGIQAELSQAASSAESGSASAAPRAPSTSEDDRFTIGSAAPSSMVSRTPARPHGEADSASSSAGTVHMDDQQAVLDELAGNIASEAGTGIA